MFIFSGNLNGSSTITFVAGVATFMNLSIDHEGQNYVLKIEAYTIPASKYHFSTNTLSFDVTERILGLFIVQEPGTVLTQASVDNL